MLCAEVRHAKRYNRAEESDKNKIQKQSLFTWLTLVLPAFLRMSMGLPSTTHLYDGVPQSIVNSVHIMHALVNDVKFPVEFGLQQF